MYTISNMSIFDNIYKRFSSVLGQPPTIGPVDSEGNPTTHDQQIEAAPDISREMQFEFKEGNVTIPKRLVDSEGNEIQRALESSEDTTYAQDGFAVTADGVGGGGSGDVASRLAVKAAVETIRAEQKKGPKGLQGQELMLQAMQNGTAAIIEDRHLNPERATMNTTFTAVLLEQGEGDSVDGTLGHVGDSGAFIFRKDTGKLEEISRDDNFYTLLSEPSLGPLSKEQAEFLSSINKIAPLTKESAAAIDQSTDKGRDVGLPSLDEFENILKAYYGHLDSLMERLSDETTAFSVERPDQQTNQQLIDRLDIIRGFLLLFHREFIKARRKKTNLTTGEAIFNLRNHITEALAPDHQKESSAVDYQIRSFKAFPGDFVLTISDGIKDVVLKQRLEELCRRGVEENMTVQQILDLWATEAKADTSARQKGEPVQQDAEGKPTLYGGDDIGAAGLRVERKAVWQGETPIPLTPAKKWEEDPLILDDWRTELKALRPEMKRWEIMRLAGRPLDQEAKQKETEALRLVEQLSEAVEDQLTKMTAVAVWKKEDVAALRMELDELEDLSTTMIELKRLEAARLAK